MRNGDSDKTSNEDETRCEGNLSEKLGEDITEYQDEYVKEGCINFIALYARSRG